jgi:hypothetical protein
MLDKTINDLVNYVALKTYFDQNKDDKIIEFAIELLRKNIEKDLEADKSRLKKNQENEKRIKDKEANKK